MQVEDKNTNLSSEDKEELVTKSDKAAFEVTSVRFEDRQVIREDLSQDSTVKEKYYGLLVCLRDIKLNRDLNNRAVYVDGQKQLTDVNGCLRWNHQIAIDHTSFKSCQVYEKTLKIGKNNIKIFRYAIDYINDVVTDLDRSQGCTVRGEQNQKMSVDSPFIMDDIQVEYGDELTDRLSDLRYRKYKAVFRSCIDLRHNTERSLKFQYLRLKVMNLENGDISYATNSVLRTNKRGCFVADVNLQYEQYRTSHWEKYRIDIEVLEGIDGRNSFTGMRTQGFVWLNPWEPRGEFSIGEFGREPSEKELKNKYAKFHLDGVMIIQIGNDTKKMQVNDYLGLTVAKTYQIVMNPYVDREHRFTKEQVTIRKLVSKGKFRLSMVVLAPKEGDMLLNKNTFHNFEFITGASKEVTVNNGVINEIMTIPFPMVDIPRLALRTMAVFKIEPVNDTGLRSTTVTGFFKARIPWIKTNVIQAPDLNLPSYIKDVYQYGFKGKNAGELLSKEEFDLGNIDSTCLEKNDGRKISESDCVKGVKEILLTGYDKKTRNYNTFVENMLGRLELQGGKHEKIIPKTLSPKKIYSNHLKKHIKNLHVLSKEQASDVHGIHFRRDDYDQVFKENMAIHGMSQNMINQMCRYGVLHRSEFKYEANTKGAQGLLQHCKSDPGKYFNVKSVRHVNRVRGVGDSYTNGFSVYFSEGQGVNFDKTDSINYNISRYFGVDMGTKVDLPFVDKISELPYINKIPRAKSALSALPNIGFKTGTTKSRNESISTRDGINFVENIGTDAGLAVEKFVVDLNADFERCSLIVSKDIPAFRKIGVKSLIHPIKYFMNLAFSQDAAKTDWFDDQYNWGMNFYICDEESKNERYTEAWYFIQSRVDSSVIRDFDGVTERKILKVVRGRKNYDEFKQALRGLKEQTLMMDNIGRSTPEDELISTWGHLVEGGLPKSQAKQFLVDHFEGSFPGTVEGHGSKKWAGRDDEIMIFDAFRKIKPMIEHKDIEGPEEKRWYEFFL